MARELNGLATDVGGSNDAALTRRCRRPIERLSVPGSTLLVGSMSGQALSMPMQRTSWARRTNAAPPPTRINAIAEGAPRGGPQAGALARAPQALGAGKQGSSTPTPTPAAPAHPIAPAVAATSSFGKKAAGKWSQLPCSAVKGARCCAKEVSECYSFCKGDAAVGWQLDVYWPPDRRWFHAEVIAYDPERRAHEIIYPIGSNGEPETEINVCLGSARVHVISQTPSPLPWRFDCVCGVGFDHTAGYNVDGMTCVQCTDCERWMHGSCVALDGVVRAPEFAAEAAKISAILGLTGETPRQHLCWLASERNFMCPHCVCADGVVSKSTGALPADAVDAYEDAESDADEAHVLPANRGLPLRVGEFRPKISSCACVRSNCQFVNSRWGRGTGAPAIACAECNSRMHIRCCVKQVKGFLSGAAALAQMGDDCTSLRFLCAGCSEDSPGCDDDAASDEADDADESDDSTDGPKARDAPPASLSGRVRHLEPCGICYQCMHSDAYVSCARRADARYECYPVLIPLAELGDVADRRGGIDGAALKAVRAPYGGGIAEMLKVELADEAPRSIPQALVPSLVPTVVLRGIVHGVEGAPDPTAPADGSLRDVYVLVHFSNGAIARLDEGCFLRYTREPLHALRYSSPVVRQLSVLEPADREDPAGGPMRVLKELLRRSDRYHCLEVRQTQKLKGTSMTTMYGVYARGLKGRGSKSRVAIKTGRFVGIYTGTVLRREETLSEAQSNQQYLFDLNNHITIDGSQGGNVTRYINHANSLAEANLDPFKLECDGEIMIAFIARRPILEGEELLYRYGDFSFLSAEWGEPTSDAELEPRSALEPPQRGDEPSDQEADGDAAAAAAATALVSFPSMAAADAAPLVSTAQPEPKMPHPLFGVSLDPIATQAPFRASVQLEEGCHWIGRFETGAEAARAFDAYVTKSKRRLPKNNLRTLVTREGDSAPAPLLVRILAGEAAGQTGTVTPGEHGYFAVRVGDDEAVVLKRADEIELDERGCAADQAPAASAAVAARKRPRAADEPVAAAAAGVPVEGVVQARAAWRARPPGESAAELRARVAKLELELARTRAQLQLSIGALAQTCDMLSATAQLDARTNQERADFAGDELACLAHLDGDASDGLDDNLRGLVRERKRACELELDRASKAAAATCTHVSGLRNTFASFLHARAQPEPPAAQAPAAEPDEGAPGPGRRKPGSATTPRVRTTPRGNRSNLIGRQVRLVHGQREGELGVISGLNGRYLLVMVGALSLDDLGPKHAPHAVINKTMECLELLPEAAVASGLVVRD